MKMYKALNGSYINLEHVCQLNIGYYSETGAALVYAYLSNSDLPRVPIYTSKKTQDVKEWLDNFVKEYMS